MAGKLAPRKMIRITTAKRGGFLSTGEIKSAWVVPLSPPSTPGIHYLRHRRPCERANWLCRIRKAVSGRAFTSQVADNGSAKPEGSTGIEYAT